MVLYIDKPNQIKPNQTKLNQTKLNQIKSNHNTQGYYFMKTLTHNITSLFGEKGKLWFNNLPDITNKLAELWDLSELTAYNNLSYNYVLKGWQTRANKERIC